MEPQQAADADEPAPADANAPIPADYEPHLMVEPPAAPEQKLICEPHLVMTWVSQLMQSLPLRNRLVLRLWS